MKKLNWKATILLSLTLALIFVLTKFCMSNYYLPEWSARNLFWAIALIVLFSGLLNQVPFSISALVGYLLGMLAGELFGGFQKDIPPHFLHYGWIIHILVFAVFCLLGVWLQYKSTESKLY